MCFDWVPDIPVGVSSRGFYGWPDFGIWRSVIIERIAPDPSVNSGPRPEDAENGGLESCIGRRVSHYLRYENREE